VHPVNAIQDVQQVQLLPHVEAEVAELLARHQQHPAVTADADHQQADAEAALADVVRQMAVAVHRLAMLRRPLWFLSK
jgi:hypothetical protein